MNLERIASLLSAGIKPAQVATIVGVTPARIYQLLSDEKLQELIAIKQASIEKDDVEEVSISAKYAAAEHVLLNQIIEQAPTAEFRDLTSALRVVSERQEKMKARTLGTKAIPSQPVQVVSIHLPSHVLQHQDVVMTNNNEVIAIGEDTLAPLPSTAVTNLFSELDKDVQSTSNRSSKENDSEAFSSSKLESIEEVEEIKDGDFLHFAAS